MAWLVWIDSKYKWHCSHSPNVDSALNDAKVMMAKYESKLENHQVTFVSTGLFSHYSLTGNIVLDTNGENSIRKCLTYPSQVWVVNTESRGEAIMTSKVDYYNKSLAKMRGERDG